MEAAGPLQLLQELFTAVERSRQVNYCNVASVTIMALDWLLTFEMEVSLVWTAKWNTTKILYFLTRYLPFIDTSVVMYHQFGFALPISVCRTTYQYAASKHSRDVRCRNGLRGATWAVWEKDKRLSYFLPILFCTVWTAGFIIMGFYLRGTQLLDANHILSACYILLMVYDAYRGYASADVEDVFEANSNPGLSFINTIIILKLPDGAGGPLRASL
ncbi:hypothetical protein D9756_000995 [Leucocoprinus leucothites]|uniref:DUF6533 domain-containing protein n=1 Tax=Leucocoprinus leucothites TaxID=201217 RepID=A0A8H5LND5_9AGAR|nr:hypothetical protein D9756_000995 [Leucoagaricus leucothites]